MFDIPIPVWPPHDHFVTVLTINLPTKYGISYSLLYSFGNLFEEDKLTAGITDEYNSFSYNFLILFNKTVSIFENWSTEQTYTILKNH